MIFIQFVKKHTGGELDAPTLTISRLVAAALPRDAAPLLEKIQSTYENYKKECKSTIPQVLISALLVAEDHRFYVHGGVDPLAILRAIWCSCYRRHLIGGSTIEQQLVRTLTGRKERSIKRKVKELALALCVSHYVPKSDVPGLYLSVAYFGWGMNGIRQAYGRLGIDHRSMTARQAAELVARLKYPEPASPTTDRLCQILWRRDYILARLNSVSVSDLVSVVRLADDETLLCNR
jgi:membrane peptidoglycan carboxypeptidase